MMKKTIILWGMALIFLASCKTPNLTYFSDLSYGQQEAIAELMDIRFQPDDKLMIVVNSRDPQLSALFNLPYTSHTVGSNNENINNSGNGILSYTINSSGEIDFPVLGKIKVAGYKREELAKFIKEELIRRNLVNDPVVTVEFAGLKYEILGEVAKPGRYNFDRDHFTLLDAISQAGDLTINGKRENVTVLRYEDGKYTTYKVNLLSGRDILNSPVYYLQQNDIVYVEPSNKRKRDSTVNGNTLYTPSFWMSLTSFLMTIGLVVFKK